MRRLTQKNGLPGLRFLAETKIQNTSQQLAEVGIVGGGLAGLTAAIILARAGRKVVLLEQKDYPRHKVCGEYISNEVRPILEDLEIFPHELRPIEIGRFQLSDPKKGIAETSLELGGFGISRYALDNHLYQKALAAGVSVFVNTKVKDIVFEDEGFKVETARGAPYFFKAVIGAHGKRSIIDRSLQRGFMAQNSAYVGVKQHFTGDFPDDLVALHNFEGGYAGISRVEEKKINFCYLTDTAVLSRYDSIDQLNEKHLGRNPYLAEFLSHSEPVFEKPLVISQVNFSDKAPVENHMLMCGDAAGLIHPLCGNGMAMAIHAAAIAAVHLNDFLSHRISRAEMEMVYTRDWRKHFQFRLRFGRLASGLFGKKMISALSVGLARRLPRVFPQVVSLSHGKLIRPNLPQHA